MIYVNREGFHCLIKNVKNRTVSDKNLNDMKPTISDYQKTNI